MGLEGEDTKNIYLTEAIAYYNLGASYEHLGGDKMEDSIKCYDIAWQISKAHLPKGHPLRKTIEDSLVTV